MFSALLENDPFIYKDFSNFWLDVFKVVCCGIVVIGKRLTLKFDFIYYLFQRRMLSPFSEGTSFIIIQY